MATDDLQQFFRSALNTRIEALETAATTMDADPAGALATIRRLAHSLRGSGTTYGHPEITDAAMRLEEAEPDQVPTLLRALVTTMKTVVTELARAAAAGKRDAAAAPDGNGSGVTADAADPLERPASGS